MNKIKKINNNQNYSKIYKKIIKFILEFLVIKAKFIKVLIFNN